MYKRLLALLAGLLYPLAFSPLGWWPLMLLSLAGFWLTYADASPREAFVRGWLYGAGLFGTGVAWLHVSMHDYGATPLWMAVPFTGLFAAFLALFPALVFYLSKRFARTQASAPLLFAGLWVLADVLRGWLLTGFPWLYAGYVMTDTWLAGIAPLGGIWLITLATVLTGTAIGQCLHQWRHALPVALLAVTLWGLSSSESFFNQVQPSAAPQQVALVQGNIPQDLRWQLYMRDITRDIYSNLTRDITDNHLVIWPEAAIPEFYQDVRRFLQQEGEALAERGGALITGIPWRISDPWGPRYHNSVAVISGGHGVYHKQKLVPFGEYVPLQSLLRGLIPFFDLPMSSFTKGQPDQDNLQVGELQLAPFICYEIVYPELVASRSADSHVLLTISNDAWFGTSAGPHQHFDMTRLRARETGRWLLRGTNNGITAIVNPKGQVTERLPQFERGVLKGHFIPMTGETLYMKLGGWPVWLFALLLVGICSRWKSRTQAEADS